MKLSPRTVQILKNFSTINQSLLFRPGNVVSTISPQKTVLAKATVSENFDKQFGIYDLPKLLGVMSIFSEPEIVTGEKALTIKDDRQKVNYTYTDPKMIIAPPTKDVDVSDPAINFRLTNDCLGRMMKAVSVLQTPEIAVTGADGTISLVSFNSKDPTSDSFSIDVGATEHEFKMVFKVENIKLLVGNYDVAINRKGIGHFKSDDVEYFITIESTVSTFTK
jgi:hypothetical protein